MRRAVLGAGVLVGSLVLAACASRAGSVADRAPGAASPVTASTSTEPAETVPPATESPGSDPPPTGSTDIEVPEGTGDPVVTDPTGRRPPALGGVDELFPALGSPDVDVLSYDVRLDLTELVAADAGATASLSGEVVVEAHVPLDVDGLALDAVGLDIRSATVDGTPAEFSVEPLDLVVDLPLAREEVVTASIEYSVDLDTSRSRAELPVGWFVQGDRAHILNQPDGARTWLPSNDHPSDKATWRFEVSAPAGSIVSANGDLVQEGTASVPWIWEESDPMATYLIHLVTGDLDLVDDEVAAAEGALELTHVVPAGELDRHAEAIDTIAPQVEYLESVFGPYPLDRYGLAFAGLVDGLAMETQGRSLLDQDAHVGGLGAFDELVLAHELAHQWYGNAVTPATWTDIWLSESFATYGQWLWFDHIGLQTIESSAGTALANRQAIGGPPTGDPTVEELFGYNVYDGGAVVLHALRSVMGDDRFFELMQRWVAEHAGTSQTSEAFADFSSAVHGSDLSDFYEEWLYAPTPPSDYPG